MTNNALAGHTDRTTSKSGFRPVSHADIFFACSQRVCCPQWAG
nr:MAG TPA: hypothetical protein [Caudoviricetes sp.]